MSEREPTQGELAERRDVMDMNEHGVKLSKLLQRYAKVFEWAGWPDEFQKLQRITIPNETAAKQKRMLRQYRDALREKLIEAGYSVQQYGAGGKRENIRRMAYVIGNDNRSISSCGLDYDEALLTAGEAILPF